jgi:hypothetical protein
VRGVADGDECTSRQCVNCGIRRPVVRRHRGFADGDPRG